MIPKFAIGLILSALLWLQFGPEAAQRGVSQARVVVLAGADREGSERSAGVAQLAGLRATASAVRCDSLPGRSGLDQYCQAVPDGGGGTSIEGASKPGRKLGSDTSERTKRALADAGDDGLTLAGLPAGPESGGASSQGGDSGSSTGSDGSSSTGSSSSRSAGAGSRSSGAPGGESGGALSSRLPSASTSQPGGVDGSLLLILAGVAALLAGTAIVRTRRS